MEPFELRSDRLVLSAPTLDDVDRITELCQDREVREWTTIPSPYIRASALEFVNALVPHGWASGTSLNWAIRQPEGDSVIGMIGVALSGNGKGEPGFWLAPEARGRGLASHAVRLVAGHVFADATLQVTHLLWWAYVGNWASRRVAWATGFRHEGTIRGGQPQRGRRRDAWLATLRSGEPMTPASRWLDVPTIHGDRLVLRPFAETDTDAVVEACNDALSQHWLESLPRPYTRRHASEFLHTVAEEAASGRSIAWAAARPGGGPARGAFTLRLTGPRLDSGTIGYWVHPRARGAGLATAAVRMMIRHAFLPAEEGGLGLRRLEVTHAAGNEASRTVIERAGFRPAGVNRAVMRLPDGVIADQYVYDMLAGEAR